MVAVGKLEDQAAALGAADRRDLDAGGVGARQEGEQAIVGDGGDVERPDPRRNSRHGRTAPGR